MARPKASEREELEEYRPRGRGQAQGRAEAVSEVVEYDPTAPPEAEAQAVAQAEETPDTVQVQEDWFRGRDELLGRLGGAEAFQAAAAQSLNPGERQSKILSVGIGFKFVAGSLTGEIALKVFVEEKLPLSEVDKPLAVPSNVAGLPTDVEEIGEVVPQSFAFRFNRPVPCGVSVGHPRVTAGTIGCLVVRNNNHLCILSNNHILANSNNARIGDEIIQPGTADRGQRPGDVIGVLEDFVPFNADGRNFVDAAVAHTSFDFVRPGHVTYTLNPNSVTATLGMTVTKNGRTTQSTIGTVTDIGHGPLPVGFESFGVATFHDQIVIRGIGGVFSRGGDSGSLIVTANSRQPVALLFAGDRANTMTFANPIGAVIRAMGIKRFLDRRPGS